MAKLGQGGMGDVYLAASDGFGGLSKLVVIKRLRNIEDPHHVAMFINEARIARQLNHPNVVQTYELGQEGGKYLIVMEYLHGPTQARLRRAAAEIGGMPWAIELEIMRNVLEGLHYAHELCGADGQKLRLVHRDLSPENVVITELGECKILDFGIAKAADSTVQTQAGFFKGKLKSMPPEQFRGEGVDRRADIFAAGVMLWEGLTGLPLWGDLNAAAISVQLAQGRIPNLAELAPDLPEDLRDLCERALHPAPEGRYESALAMRAAVVKYIQSNGLLVTRAQLAAFVDPLFRQERDNIDRMIRVQLAHHNLRFSVPMGATVPLERKVDPSAPSPTRPVPAVAAPAKGWSAFTILFIVAGVLGAGTWAWHRFIRPETVAVAPPVPLPAPPTEAPPRPSERQQGQEAARYLTAAEELLASGSHQAAEALLTKLEALSITEPTLVARVTALREALAAVARPRTTTEAAEAEADPAELVPSQLPDSERGDERRRRRLGRVAVRERIPSGAARRETSEARPRPPREAPEPSPPTPEPSGDRSAEAPVSEEPPRPAVPPASSPPPASTGAAPAPRADDVAPAVPATPVPRSPRGPVVSARPVADLPIPDLPRAFQPSSRAQLIKMCAMVESAVVSLAGVSPNYARDITAPFREVVREDSEIYPIGMYFFIIREAGLGHERTAAAAALAAAQRNGMIKRFKDLPDRAR